MAKLSDYTRTQVILARTIWMEARGEGARGMQASGNVLLNRAALAENNPQYAKIWGKGIEGVATHSNYSKKAGRHVHMYSAWNPADPNYSKGKNVTVNTPSFVTALRIAKGLETGRYRDNTNGADHYYNPNPQFYKNGIPPRWTRTGVKTAHIGQHQFRNLSGIDPRELRSTGNLMASNTTFKERFARNAPLPTKNIPIPTPANRSTQIQETPNKPRIIIHGDSHMQAVYNSNKDSLNYDVIDAARNGARGAGTKEYGYPSDLKNGDTVLVGLGTNDTLNSTDVDGFAQSMEARVDAIQNTGAKAILLGIKLDQDHPLYNRSVNFNNAIKDVAHSTGASYFDVSSLELPYKKDNVHFLDSKYPQILDKAIAGATAVTAPSHENTQTLAQPERTFLNDTVPGLLKHARTVAAGLLTAGTIAVTPGLADKLEPIDSVKATNNKAVTRSISKNMAQFKDVTRIKFNDGDTVYKHAIKQGVQKGDMSKFFKAFEDANSNIKNASKVRAGQTYNVPTVKKLGYQQQGEQKISVTYGVEKYVVKKGDTLSGIFKKLNLGDLGDAKEFAKEQGFDANKLKIGQALNFTTSSM